jgi:hypothetical protein
VTINGTDSVRVAFRHPSSAQEMAVARLQIERVKEASKLVSPRAPKRRCSDVGPPAGFRVLSTRQVRARSADLMVALSSRSFAVRPSGPDDRLTPFPPLFPGATWTRYDNPYFYGPYYSNYYYSPYFFSPFGYSYLRYYPGFYVPVAVIVPGEGGGGGIGSDHNRPPENGRAINGLGYTRVDRRGAETGSSDGGGGSVRSSGSAGGLLRGYTAGGDASSGASSSCPAGQQRRQRFQRVVQRIDAAHARRCR